MFSSVELHRILAEWRLRIQRAKDILQPPSWAEKDWRQFAQALALMVRDHGRSWIIDPNVYWDLRWNLQDGGELVCQIEHVPNEKTSLVVAQNGGFASAVGSYTWLWAEFDMDGRFARDPYWVEGTWKDALTAFLLPLDRQSAYLLAGRAETPQALLLQEGARPNDRTSVPLLPAMKESELEHAAQPVRAAEAAAESGPAKTHAPGVAAVAMEEPGEIVIENTDDKPPIEIAEPVAEKAPELKPDEASGAPANGTPANGTPRIDTPAPFAIRWGMPQKLTWKDTDEIAYALIDAHPDQDPLKLSFPKLHKLVLELEDFGDDPEKSTESILESIQMAWYEEVK